ncbi:M48 family metallopeptidase [Neisseria montereyensis]|uniref:M48 family metallopeptidase n=1 Tax=Neisseria montereyensis TaxID=2973938 RepID=A0ABT2FEW4_9NEIS|nr:M48 family metallopeptidase [Neisseria montereyensis]MCS4534733.1 M48 family metallopeptidase [Neisseria montereyensis]
MCQHHDMHTVIKKSRHRLELPLFFLTAFLTIATFLVVLALSFYKQETLEFTQDITVAQYRDAHKEAKGMTDTQILDSLSEDERELIGYVERINPLLVLLAPVGFLLLIIYQIGKLYGGVRADGVRVGPNQFGEVYKIWAEMAQKLGLKKTPELYIQNGSGALNAFATCLPGYRSFGVVYSDILERALANNDEKSLRFILGHELGHVRYNHVTWWYNMLNIIGNMPGFNYIIGMPLSRSREYGCDKLGAMLSEDTEQRGLLMLAAGKHLYRQVNAEAYYAEHVYNRSYWGAVSNFFNDHPSINWRISALQQNKHGSLIWDNGKKK